jgi:hypothetical protein
MGLDMAHGGCSFNFSLIAPRPNPWPCVVKTLPTSRRSHGTICCQRRSKAWIAGVHGTPPISLQRPLSIRESKRANTRQYSHCMSLLYRERRIKDWKRCWIACKGSRMVGCWVP